MYACKALARRHSQLSDKRVKWEYQCALCGGWFKGKETQVDHIVPCGTLKSFEDLAPFVRRLFCEADGLQVVCKPCHAEKTNARHKGD
jgi:5-methylcytosine-specific restriction endonuclease McrA